MGTDIHAFIEMDWSEEEKTFEQKDQIHAFNFGELLISRDYELFNALADGRSCYCTREEIERHCLYSPRGIPKYYNEATNNRYFHLVDDRDRADEIYLELAPKLSTINNEQADRYLQDGSSFLGEAEEIWHEGASHQARRISHPHWHSCSWLTLKEIYESLEHFDLEIGELDFTFRVVLKTMINLEQELGMGRTRLLFWFDS